MVKKQISKALQARWMIDYGGPIVSLESRMDWSVYGGWYAVGG